MGKGAGTLILESLQHATRRKARVYAEVAGYAATSEAYHMVIPKEDGLDIGRTMTLALQNAKAEPKQVDYVNAHATSTIIGDEVEVRGLRAVFGKSVEKILVNATKSLIGHTLGASGAIAAIVSTLSLDQSVIHPTVNYTNPDPNCALPGISPKTQKKSLRMALVNAFGFGSNIAVLVLKKFLVMSWPTYLNGLARLIIMSHLLTFPPKQRSPAPIQQSKQNLGLVQRRHPHE
jgi:3-oxoacyl-[acyl-carrier-protein] synthase II